MDAREALNNWFRRIAGSAEPAKEFEVIAQEAYALDANDFLTQISNAFGLEETGRIRGLADATCQFILALNEPAPVFYSRLWRQINDNPLFQRESEKLIALGAALTIPGMPYKQGNTISMDDEEFVRRVQSLSHDSRDVLGMASRHFSQRTESASAVLELINSHADPRDRAVLGVVLFDAIQAGRVRLFS